jgi:hypothetical protein
MRQIRDFLSMAIRHKKTASRSLPRRRRRQAKNRSLLQISTAPGSETVAVSAVNFAPESS